jgi:dihydroflavonol-4-reductase
MNIQPDNLPHPNLSSVLVTGGTGFLGAYILRDLVNAGYRVSALRRRKVIPGFIAPDVLSKVNWIDGDIMDPVLLEEVMTGTDAVIHSAAVVSYHAADRENLFATNIEGTANVVNAAIATSIKKFIHVSSVAALGKSNNNEIVTEQTQWQESKHNTAYGVSKHRGEMEVWRGVAEGLNAIIVNPSLILGYGDWNTSSSAIFKSVYKNFPWYTKGVTGFVDVEDVSRAIVQLLATNIHSERFIINGDNWSYHKLFNTIADAFGKKRPTMEASPFLASFAWRLEKFRSMLTGKKPLLTKESTRAGMSNTRYNNHKLIAALPGFVFTDIEETIKKACDNYATKQSPV